VGANTAKDFTDVHGLKIGTLQKTTHFIPILDEHFSRGTFSRTRIIKFSAARLSLGCTRF
jgi:hypothetical protein